MTPSHRHAGIAVALLAFACISPATVLGQSRLYLAEYKFNDPKLYSMNPDGSGLTNLPTIPAADWAVLGLFVDAPGGKIYWTHGFGPGAIRRANLDGSNVETIASGLSNPRGLDVDVAGGMVYWSDTVDHRMYRASVDGSGPQSIVDMGTQLGRPRLDLPNGRLYYADIERHEIRRCNLDGSNNQLLFSAHVDQPQDIALDIPAGKLYWIDSQSMTNYVASANLDGTAFLILHQDPGGLSGLNEIELDVAGGKVYWADDITPVEKGAWRVNLDGSSAERIFASPAGWNAGALSLIHDVPTVTKATTWGRVKALYR